ncbi:MAG: DegT/DnrJ/EryC1/StrS family aminotransferase [Pseudomonadota bacterium]
MNVPFVDLRAQYLAHKAEFDGAIEQVLSNTAFVGGRFVKEFEAAYASTYGVEHCISCANGTDAIYIALRMLGIGEGDEVITTAASWISTSETITQAGARPVFVDSDEYFLIDTEQLEAAITEKTRAIIPVHLYGQAANMAAVMDIAARHGLKVIEDCAQAHLAEWDGKRVGTWGDAATFSFYPGKNLGAYGDAGAIVTNDEETATKCRMFSNHGALKKHAHQIEGINSRLDGIQAAILSAKLPHLADWTAARQAVAREYDTRLPGIGDLALPQIQDRATHVYHLYVVRTAHRDALREFLTGKGIGTGIHYPTALPLLDAYGYLGHSADDFPVSARNSGEILSLPIFPELSTEALEYTVESIREFFDTV